MLSHHTAQLVSNGGRGGGGGCRWGGAVVGNILCVPSLGTLWVMDNSGTTSFFKEEIFITRVNYCVCIQVWISDILEYGEENIFLNAPTQVQSHHSVSLR